MYEVAFTAPAAEDYKKLDGSLKKLANAQIDKLSENPLLGEELGNKNNIDLTGYYKIYFAKKKYRIVYRIIEFNQIEVVEIWGIGKRDKMAIYRTVANRRMT
ncbi:hypothetical protein AGMMS50212_04030 [Spirochaetia bacterium]|nr:hypothetical protein AGMMS50212_04030 [Spirochaetia bacterium]